MKRNDFVRFVQDGKTNHVKKQLEMTESVCDPTYAQSGRDLIFNPLPIDYRMQYPEGVPLNEENPHEFKEYDKLYPDSFAAAQQAKEDLQGAETKLDAAQKEYETQKQSQQQQ